MKALLVGVALLALTVPVAYAQSGSQEVPPPEMEGPGQYRVFFAFDRANLSQADRQIIAQAVEDYRRTGTARITATGHTDTSGPPPTTSSCRSAVPRRWRASRPPGCPGHGDRHHRSG